ncbi:hypothetical protein GW17_00037740 [Ensete ventricosum]|nr:hypothetical protein GW17_00037740 [Ensete ventricosum]
MAVVNIAEPDDSVVQEEHEEERKPRAPKRAAHQFRWRGSFPVRNQKGAVEPDSHSDVAEVSRETWVGRQRSTASGCSNQLKTTFFKSASHLSFALVAPLPQPLIVPITLLLGRSSTSFTTEIHYCSSSGDCYLLVIGRSLFFVTTIDLRYSTALQGATAGGFLGLCWYFRI